MEGNLVLVIIVFLVAMAVLAGMGIGLVIGLALGNREERPREDSKWARAELSVARTSPSTSATAERVEFAPMTTTGGIEPAATAAPQSARPHGRGQSWSVALAIGVIVICCMCTFLLAAAVTIGR
jgi:hypothetical protein